MSDPALADQVIAELTGVPTEAFFRSTASVRHHELSDLARDETALRDRLQASISGADRGTGLAKKKLERALFGLTTKGDKNPGLLKQAEHAVASGSAAVETGETALAQLERDRDTLAGARERRNAAEQALAEQRGMLEKARQAERLHVERAAAQERFERFRDAVVVATELDTLAADHPSVNPCRCSARRSSGCGPSMAGCASCGPCCRARSRSSSTRRRNRPGGRSPAGPAGIVVGIVAGRWLVAAETLGVIALGPVPLYAGAGLAGLGI